MPERIIAYYQKHRFLVEENLIASGDPHDIEAIHDMRLSIKRIKVVGKLCDQLSKGNFTSKEKLAELNRFFKSSGRLRDSQVTRQLLIDLGEEGLEPVIEFFERKEVKQRIKYESALSEFNSNTLQVIEKAIGFSLQGINARIVMMAAKSLLMEYQGDISSIFHGSTKEKRMHEIRTRLKDINYLNNIFDGQLNLPDHLNIAVERLRELGEMAGSWHDCLNLEKILEKFIKKHPGTDQNNSIAEIVSKIKARKQGLQQEYACILMNEMKI